MERGGDATAGKRRPHVGRCPAQANQILRPWLLILIFGSVGWQGRIMSVHASCPNYCSGHGQCNEDTTCTCFQGFQAADCSERTCSKGVPWFAVSASTDSAHTGLVECSGVGKCDRSSGECNCDPAFTGRACDRMTCNEHCSGHGRCITMTEAASTQDDKRLFTTTTYDLWDAYKVMGCVCDKGYTGYDCSLRECVKGHDPLTTGSPVDEVQAFTCTATSGTFKFKFRDEVTGEISYNAWPSKSSESGTGSGTGVGESLESKLETLYNIEDVIVTVADSSSSKICDSDGATFKITFTHEHGDLPTLSILGSSISGSLSYISGSPSVTGTKTDQECSNRGSCDRSTGLCTCNDGFLSSDGTGTNVAGDNGDCGRTAGISACAGAAPCSGHGDCSGAHSYQCSCWDGFTGSDCSLRVCPQGKAWFDEPSAPNIAHANAECSNRGICDRSAGTCTCMSGFTGAACERLQCPQVDGVDCGGNGMCVSLEQAASKRESNGVPAATTYGATQAEGTWDRDKIYGCVCNDKRYVQLHSLPGYTGHDCSSKMCMYGDNPKTGLTGTVQVDEKQRIVCVADGGYFTVSFRQYTTDKIWHNAAAAVDYVQLATCSITLGSNTLTSVSTDLTTQLEAGDRIQLYSSTHADTRNFTVSSVTSSTVVLTEPLGMQSATSVPLRKVTKSVKYALEELPTIANVTVKMTTDGDSSSASTACSSGSGTYIDIEFNGNFGDLPELTTSSSGLSLSGGTSTTTVSTRVTGTKDEVECSGQGLCDREKGLCKCFEQMSSSNGQGDIGRRGDCGFREVNLN